MSTRSMVGIRETNGATAFIYVHWDGYPEWVGRKLLCNHDNEASARWLVSEGDASSIGQYRGDEADIPEDADRCVFYARDRGEPVVIHHNSDGRAQEYAYVWDVCEGRWLWASLSKDYSPLTLEDCGLEEA